MSIDTIKKMHEQKISGGYFALLRITLGFVFLTTALSNISKGGLTSSGYIGIIDSVLTNIEPIRTLIQTLIYPNAALMAPVWMMMEIGIGISLIFGILTRPVSLVGIVVSMSLMFTTLGNDWIWSYILMIVGFFTCMVTGAGKWYGIDFWLQDKIPQNLQRFLV